MAYVPMSDKDLDLVGEAVRNFEGVLLNATGRKVVVMVGFNSDDDEKAPAPMMDGYFRFSDGFTSDQISHIGNRLSNELYVSAHDIEGEDPEPPSWRRGKQKVKK